MFLRRLVMSSYPGFELARAAWSTAFSCTELALHDIKSPNAHTGQLLREVVSSGRRFPRVLLPFDEVRRTGNSIGKPAELVSGGAIAGQPEVLRKGKAHVL